jgi:hypothetical protein
MEILIFLFVVWLIYAFSRSGGSDGGDSDARRTATRASREDSNPPPKAASYRPMEAGTSSRRSVGTSVIRFTSVSVPSAGESGNGASQNDLADLRDAFTGEPLIAEKGLYQCRKCTVFYHAESFNVLRSENRGCCVACGSSDLVALARDAAGTARGQNFDPSVVQLANVRKHIGRVVTFEGYVHEVFVSRRGSDYAVMFENKSWTKGFKLVFMKGSVARCGGGTYVKSLRRKTVRARGLVIDHPIFGLEILVSERSMILSVR